MAGLFSAHSPETYDLVNRAAHAKNLHAREIERRPIPFSNRQQSCDLGLSTLDTLCDRGMRPSVDNDYLRAHCANDVRSFGGRAIWRGRRHYCAQAKSCEYSNGVPDRVRAKQADNVTGLDPEFAGQRCREGFGVALQRIEAKCLTSTSVGEAGFAPMLLTVE
ncbi:hypothetical protein BJX64DRAFT_294963 [Aspergillus heterothallicus]